MASITELLYGIDDCVIGGAPPALVIAAHPDDEIIGLGGKLKYFNRAIFVNVTDGAPLNMGDAQRAGFKTREEYAAARNKEVLKALGCAGVEPKQYKNLGITDKEAFYSLAKIARLVEGLVDEFAPDMILTHPYEGGHPDHDATAFGVHAAMKLIGKKGGKKPRLIEFTSYHGRRCRMIMAEFLPPEDVEVVLILRLSKEERLFKKKLLSAFASQQGILNQFPINLEKYRLAPRYDFLRPPHPGTLYYEFFDWGISGGKWRECAGAALGELGIDESVL